MRHTTAGPAFQTGVANTQMSSREGGRATAESSKGKLMEEMSLKGRKAGLAQGSVSPGGRVEEYTTGILTGQFSSGMTVPCTASCLACLLPKANNNLQSM